jgi:hypothetical protein
MRRCAALPGGRALAAALVFALASPAAAATPSRILQVVTDPQSRFKISFPLDWQVVRAKAGPEAVLAFGPGRTRQTRPNVTVVIEDLPRPLSAAAYAATAKPKMRAALPALAIIKEGPATVAHRPAYYRYYTWRRGRTRLEQVQTYFVVGRRAFVLTGTTLDTPERIRHDTPVIAQIFETFVPLSR